MSFHVILFLILSLGFSSARADDWFKMAEAGREALRECKLKKYQPFYMRDVCYAPYGDQPFTTVVNINAALEKDRRTQHQLENDLTLAAVVSNLQQQQLINLQAIRGDFQKRNGISNGGDICPAKSVGPPALNNQIQLALVKTACERRAQIEKVYSAPTNYDFFLQSVESVGLASSALKAQMRKDLVTSNPKFVSEEKTRRTYQDLEKSYINGFQEVNLLKDSPLWQKKLSELKAGKAVELSDEDRRELSRAVDKKYEEEIKQLQQDISKTNSTYRSLFKLQKVEGVTPLHLQLRAQLLTTLEELIIIAPQDVAMAIASSTLNQKEICDFLYQNISELRDGNTLLDNVMNASDTTATVSGVLAIAAGGASVVFPVIAPVARGLGAVAASTTVTSIGAQVLNLDKMDRGQRLFQSALLRSYGGEETIIYFQMKAAEKKTADMKSIGVDVTKQVALVRASKWLSDLDTIYGAYNTTTKPEENALTKPIEAMSGFAKAFTPHQIKVMNENGDWARKERLKGRSRDEVAEDILRLADEPIQGTR